MIKHYEEHDEMGYLFIQYNELTCDECHDEVSKLYEIGGEFKHFCKDCLDQYLMNYISENAEEMYIALGDEFEKWITQDILVYDDQIEFMKHNPEEILREFTDEIWDWLGVYEVEV